MKDRRQCISVLLPSIVPATLHLTPHSTAVCADSSAHISKVMWNVTNDPPAASLLKSILCQKDKMSRGRIFSAAAWPRSVFVLLRMMICVLRREEGGRNKINNAGSSIYCLSCWLVGLAAGLCWCACLGILPGSHVDLCLSTSASVSRDSWI